MNSFPDPQSTDERATNWKSLRRNPPLSILLNIIYLLPLIFILEQINKPYHRQNAQNTQRTHGEGGEIVRWSITTGQPTESHMMAENTHNAYFMLPPPNVIRMFFLSSSPAVWDEFVFWPIKSLSFFFLPLLGGLQISVVRSGEYYGRDARMDYPVHPMSQITADDARFLSFSRLCCVVSSLYT